MTDNSDTAMFDRLAEALHRAIGQSGSEGALVLGDPLVVSYDDNRLIDGVIIDGMFDLKNVARYLIDDLEMQKRVF